VDVDNGDGTGFHNAPANTTINFIKVSGPGTLSAGSCMTIGTTGSCSITDSSATPGVDTVKATTDVTVGFATLHRETDNTGGSSGPATKTWVDANIQITPETAFNPINTNHTLTGHVNVNTGTGGYVNAPAGTTINFSLTNASGATASFVGPNFCTTAGGTGSCTVVINSSTTGTTTIKATTTVLVGGVSLIRTTGDGKVGDSVDANKTWVTVMVTTDIHAGPGAADTASAPAITSATSGDTVHDKATVIGGGGPTPTGSVTFTVYLGNTICSGTGTPAGMVTLDANGVAHPSLDATVPDGGLSYKAHYNGQPGVYPQADGPCEPLTTELPCPAGSFAFHQNANGDLVIVYDQFPAPNDNSYGVNAVGWGTKGHTFSNLVGSDHAGFQLVDPNGVVKLDFAIDYITATAGTVSGYASRGAGSGGDGGINIAADGQGATGITGDSSLVRNLNLLGYFAGGVQTVGKPGTAGCPVGTQNCFDLLVNSPATLNTTDNYTLKTPNPFGGTTTYAENGKIVNGWDFHDTYFVNITAARLVSIGFLDGGGNPVPGWKVQPNADELHNSPAKPCPCPTAVDPNPTLDVHDNGNGTTTFTYTQSLAVNDNSYGTGTDASWDGKSHTFSNLTGSDKAEFLIKNGNGQVVNDFFIDYISAKTGTPSGFGSLGAGGGDGSLVTGPAPLSWTTSLDNNMNIVCPPPAGPWTTNSPPSPATTGCLGWEFKSIYTVTVSNAIFGPSGLGEVTVPFVHNSPSKPLTCPTSGGGQCQLAVTKVEVKTNQVKITITNSASTDAFLTALTNLSWPEGINGKLKQVKLDGDVIYNGTAQSSPVASLTPLVSDQNKRKINHNSSDTLTLVFEKNASTTLSNYTGTASFGSGCDLKLLGP
jgi:hypothetical protein